MSDASCVPAWSPTPGPSARRSTPCSGATCGRTAPAPGAPTNRLLRPRRSLLPPGTPLRHALTGAVSGRICRRLTVPRIVSGRPSPDFADAAIRTTQLEDLPTVPTYSPKASEINRTWYVVDAEGLVLGRLATEVARVLRGKHKPTFAPHIDTGDHVIIVNADKVVLTADKADKKMVYRHSGYPGGIQEPDLRRPARPASRPRPCAAPSGACSPRTASAGQQLTKLKVYAGPNHPHAAQKPAAARARRPGRARTAAPRIGASVPSRSSKPPVAASRPSPASASVPATGKITVNGRDVDDYFPSDTHRMILTEPLRLTELDRGLRHRRHHRRWRPDRSGRRAAPRHRPGPDRARRRAAPGRSRRPASSRATPARRNPRSTASRRPARLRSTPSASGWSAGTWPPHPGSPGDPQVRHRRGAGRRQRRSSPPSSRSPSGGPRRGCSRRTTLGRRPRHPSRRGRCSQAALAAGLASEGARVARPRRAAHAGGRPLGARDERPGRDDLRLAQPVRRQRHQALRPGRAEAGRRCAEPRIEACARRAPGAAGRRGRPAPRPPATGSACSTSTTPPTPHAVEHLARRRARRPAARRHCGWSSTAPTVRRREVAPQVLAALGADGRRCSTRARRPQHQRPAAARPTPDDLQPAVVAARRRRRAWPSTATPTGCWRSTATASSSTATRSSRICAIDLARAGRCWPTTRSWSR